MLNNKCWTKCESAMSSTPIGINADCIICSTRYTIILSSTPLVLNCICHFVCTFSGFLPKEKKEIIICIYQKGKLRFIRGKNRGVGVGVLRTNGHHYCDTGVGVLLMDVDLVNSFDIKGRNNDATLYWQMAGFPRRPPGHLCDIVI